MSQTLELKRDLGTWSAIAIVIGTVIGSGIFLVPKTMVLKVGSAEMVFAVWVFGGLLSLMGALTYAELAGAMPEAGGEYVFLREAYGPFWGFLYGWTQLLVARSGSVATLATAFFYYLANFFPGLEAVVVTVPLPLGGEGRPLEIRNGQILAIVIIFVMGGLNYFGVRIGGRVQVAITAVKVLLIAALVLVGLGAASGTTANFRTEVAAPGGVAGFFAALVAALWAYDGWNNVSMVSSEIRNPRRNLPLSLIAGTLAVMAIYLFVNAAYFYVLPAQAVASSDRVAAEMMRRILGETGAAWVSVAAMISILAALNGSLLAGSRVPFAMSRGGQFLRAIGYVHPVYRTPTTSILALSVWAGLLVLSGRYEQLFTCVIFVSWILYGMTAASVIVLRRKRPDLDRPYRTLLYPLTPVLFVLVSIGLVISTLIDSPRESLIGVVLILAGVPFYIHWKKRNLLL